MIHHAAVTGIAITGVTIETGATKTWVTNGPGNTLIWVTADTGTATIGMTADTVSAIETATGIETATDIETGHGDEGTGVNREKDRAACLCFSQGGILLMRFLQGTNRYTRRKFYELASCEAFLPAHNLGVTRRSP
jgi:hypothetical protein